MPCEVGRTPLSHATLGDVIDGAAIAEVSATAVFERHTANLDHARLAIGKLQAPLDRLNRLAGANGGAHQGALILAQLDGRIESHPKQAIE